MKILGTEILPNLAADPGSGVAGQIYWNTATKLLRYHDGTAWKTANGLLQSQFAEVAANVSTNSAVFIDLAALTLTFTTGANPVIIMFTVAGQIDTANATANFQLLVDGVVKRGCSFSLGKNGGVTWSASLVYKVTGLTAGSHTFKIQWKTSAGTVSISPVALPGVEHASLLAEEVTV